MRLIGFNFSKINLEKKTDNFKNLKIKTGINILDVKEVKSKLLNDLDSLITIKFDYQINYEPNIAILNFQGNILFSTSTEEAKEISSSWKDKKIPEKFKLNIFNLILKKSSLKALQFEEEFNLPPHIPLPSFKSTETKE